jgi:hypothetical protein
MITALARLMPKARRHGHERRELGHVLESDIQLAA